MLGLGYYTMNDPDEQLDTLETPFPVALPGEWSEPVPGWGMNPLLAGPAVIAVGAFGAAPVATPFPGLPADFPQIPGLPTQLPELPSGIQLVQPAPVQDRPLQAFTPAAVQILGPLAAAFDGRVEKQGLQVIVRAGKAQSLPGTFMTALMALRTKGLAVMLPTDVVQRLTRVGSGQDDGARMAIGTDDLDAAAALGAGYAVFYQPTTWKTYNVFQKNPLLTLVGVGIVGVGAVILLKGNR